MLKAISKFISMPLLYKVTYIIMFSILIFCVAFFFWFMLQINNYVKSDEYKATVELDNRRKEYLLNWYNNQTEIPAGEFLFELEKRYNKNGNRQSFIEDIRKPVWDIYYEKIVPIYQKKMESLSPP